MASIPEQVVVADTGSEEVYHLRTSYNALLGILSTYITGVSTAVNIAAVNALAVTAEAALEASTYSITNKPNVPASQRMRRPGE